MIGAIHTVTVVKYDNEEKTFKRFFVSPCTWIRTKVATMGADGYFKKSDKLISRMPINQETMTIQKGDLLILGKINFSKKINSLAELKNTYPDHMTVTSIRKSDICSSYVNHIRIEGD